MFTSFGGELGLNGFNPSGGFLVSLTGGRAGGKTIRLYIKKKLNPFSVTFFPNLKDLIYFTPYFCFTF